MKPFRKFLTDLLASYAITKKMFLGQDIQPHSKIEIKEFSSETLLISSSNDI